MAASTSHAHARRGTRVHVVQIRAMMMPAVRWSPSPGSAVKSAAQQRHVHSAGAEPQRQLHAFARGSGTNRPTSGARTQLRIDVGDHWRARRVRRIRSARPRRAPVAHDRFSPLNQHFAHSRPGADIPPAATAISPWPGDGAMPPIGMTPGTLDAVPLRRTHGASST